MKRMMTYEEVCELMLDTHLQSGATWRSLGRATGYEWQTVIRYLRGERPDRQGPALEDIGAALGLKVEQVYIVEDDDTLVKKTETQEDETE